MARNELDREDLLREAAALVERVEFKLTHAPSDDPIVVGFRANGAMSIFFGVDPVYQFNAKGELRRAFCDGRLYKAVRGRLASLRRERRSHEVQLLRRDLSDAEQVAFIDKVSTRLQSFAHQLSANELTVVGQVPDGADVVERVKSWFATCGTISVAKMPNA
jgi:hypothetical protein